MFWRIVLMLIVVFGFSRCGKDALLDGGSEEKPNHTEGDFILTLPGNVKMAFITIPPGTLMVGKYEVTQAQYISVQTYEPWKNHSGPIDSLAFGPDFPAFDIGWYGARDFIKKISEIDSTGVYRLLRQDEWEYACGAGRQTDFWFGDILTAFDPAGYDEYLWYSENSGGQLQKVGQKMPNPFGLYDMHGNVEELVDTFVEIPFKIEIVCTPDYFLDPSGNFCRNHNIHPSVFFKGGNFRKPIEECKTNSHYRSTGGIIDDHLRSGSGAKAHGFRIVRLQKR